MQAFHKALRMQVSFPSSSAGEGGGGYDYVRVHSHFRFIRRELLRELII